MTRLRPLLARTGLFAALAVETALILVFTEGTTIAHQAILLYGLATPAFLIATWLLPRSGLSSRRALLVVLGAAALFQLIAVTRPTTTSDDNFRYVWDAKVQLSGTDPYRFAPEAPQLRQLRDNFLFPSSPCPYAIPGGCTRINRPDVRTIYPPVAEGAFSIIRVASFGGNGGVLPLQLAGALGCLAIALLLARRARDQDLPAWSVAIWAWCPLPVTEYGNAGHIDWLGVLFIVLAIAAVVSQRFLVAGLLVGAAIATKLYPAVVLASMLRRRPAVVLGGAVGLVALSYLPHVLAVGSDVIGYLPGYLKEEQYSSGERLLLLGAVLPHPVDTVVGALIVAVTALWAWRRTDPQAPEGTAVVVMGIVLLVGTPNFGWYAGLLLALVALSGALEWLPVALAPTLVYLARAEFPTGLSLSRLIYAVAAAMTVVSLVARTWRPEVGRDPAPLAGVR